MVKKVFNLLNREFKNINQAAIILGTFTLLSQILGLIRDRSFAHFLGPSSSLDVYYAAFKIPDFIFMSVASLASVTVMLPFLVDKLGVREDGELNGNSESAKRFLSQTFSIFLYVMVFVSALAFLFMPKLVVFVAPGFNPLETKELIMLSRVMVLSPIFLGLSNLFGSVTQMFKKFFVFALSPVFYNIGIILGVVLLYPIFGLAGLAYGVILGALMHLFIQIPVIIKQGFLPKLLLKINFKELGEMVRISLPRTIGLSLSTISLIAIIAIASKIGTGSISIFQFSLNLQNVPLGIIGISYSVAAFPTLARFFSSDNIKEFVAYISLAARQIIFWSLPVMFLFIVLRAQIVRVVLGTGNFSWEDTRLVAASLALFAISITAQSLILLFTRGYYAAANTKKPLYINLFSTAVTIFCAFYFVDLFVSTPGIRYFFESLLRIENIKHTEIVMLPLAYSFGSILNAFLLWFNFKKDFSVKNYKETFVAKSFFQSFAAAFFVGDITYVCLGLLDDVFNINTFWGILGQGLFSGLIGLFAGYVVLKVLHNDQIKQIETALKTKRFWRANVVRENEDELHTLS
jgi:putative peptidoglycan lipid II flippase